MEDISIGNVYVDGRERECFSSSEGASVANTIRNLIDKRLKEQLQVVTMIGVADNLTQSSKGAISILRDLRRSMDLIVRGETELENIRQDSEEEDFELLISEVV